MLPDYMVGEEKIIDDTRLVTGVYGTKANLIFTFNKPIKKAALVSKNETLELTASKDDRTVYSYKATLEKSGKYELQISDDKERKNQLPPQITIKVHRNTPPSFKGKSVNIVFKYLVNIMHYAGSYS